MCEYSVMFMLLVKTTRPRDKYKGKNTVGGFLFWDAPCMKNDPAGMGDMEQIKMMNNVE